MSSVLKINPVVPEDMKVPPMQSTSAHINERRFEAVTPITSATSYSYSDNSQLEFLINSSSEFVDFASSYIRFTLTGVALNKNGSNTTTKTLGVGGAHSLFREMSIEASNGTVLQRIPRYNKWYAMISQSLPQNYVEQVGSFYGDSIGGTTATHLGGSSVDTARKYYANTATSTGTITCCFQPALPLLMLGSLFPVALVRGGLRIKFTLERPEYVLYETASWSEFTGAAYTIKNPRYVCCFVQPSNDIMQSYIQQFNGDGLSYSFKGFSNHSSLVNSDAYGLQAFQYHVNARSAEAIFAIIQSVAHETISTSSATGPINTMANDSVGEFLKANLSSYQYYSGATRYPLQTAVELDASNSEAMQHYLDAVNKQGSSMFSVRCNPEDWMSRVSYWGNTDSTKLILAAKLARGDDSYSGLDLSLIPITGEFTFSSTYSLAGSAVARYINVWIQHSATITISSSGIFIRI